MLDGGGGGNRTRVREQSTVTSTGVGSDSTLAAWMALNRASCNQPAFGFSYRQRRAPFDTSLIKYVRMQRVSGVGPAYGAA